MEVNLKKRMKETTMMTMVCILINASNFVILFLANTDVTGESESTNEPEGETETEDAVESDNEIDDNVSDEDGDDVSIIEDQVKDDIPESNGDDDDEDDDEDDVEDDDGGDIPLIPKRSCFPFCEVHKGKKEKKPKKDKKETLWRVVARGNGLFFARMHLFTDDTFSKAWMYPPSLKTNDTIYAGVVLANGPSEATISLTRYKRTILQTQMMS